MVYARQWKGRLVDDKHECPGCKGLGAISGRTGGFILCPLCHGTGMNPALNEEREETARGAQAGR